MSTLHPFCVRFNEPTPSIEELHSGMNTATASGYETAVAAQEEAESHFASINTELESIAAEYQRHDASHCRDCGCFTSGSVIGGGHVQACDRCITRWVIAQIGADLVRSELATA